MKVKELLERTEYELLTGGLDQEVKGLSFDNRTVKEGDVFVCIKGAYFDTHSKVAEIAKVHPAAIIVSSEWAEQNREVIDGSDADIVEVNDTRAAKAAVSAAYYGYPSEKMTVIGVTGSKGKTTATHMIAAALEKAGLKVGMVGTAGGYINGEMYHFGTTTPDSDKLQEFLAKMADEHCEYAVVEASSQGLKLHRTDMVDFDYGVFLNISEGDHISPTEHEDFDDYLSCKRKLLRSCKTAIVNADDPHIEEMLDGVTADVIKFGNASDGIDHKISDIREEVIDGDPFVSFELTDSYDERLKIGMPGVFNVYNAVPAVIISKLEGIDSGAVLSALREIKVPGRLQMIYRSDDLSVVIDYAHNGISTRNLLKALRAYSPKRLVIVFGCGGDRDVSRRPEMGEAAGELADLSIITTEHNRFEEFSEILKGIMSGMEKTDGKYKVIENRKEAIRSAILDSEPGDLVTIVGIGNDGFQHDHGKNIPHDDISFAEDTVKEYLERKV